MERNDLIKIALTAIISVVAKEFLVWLVPKIKTQSKSIKSKIGIRLNVFTAIIFDDLITLFAGCFNLYFEVANKAPVSRFAVLLISLWTAFSGFWLYSLIGDIHAYKAYKKHLKNSDDI
jgi:hypothetical protein